MMGHPEHLEVLEASGKIAAGFPEEGSGWHLLYAGGNIPWVRLRPDPRTYDLVCILVSDPALSPLAVSLKEVLRDSLLVIPARPPMGEQVHAALHPLRYLPVRSPERLLRVAPWLTLKESGETRNALKLQTQRDAGLQPVIIHPGSGSPRKNWPTKRFVELLRTLKEGCPTATPWLLEGPADGEAVRAVLHGLGGGMEIPVLRPHSLTDLAALLQETSLFVGNDSGVTHLSAALGVPTIGLFGPSDPTVWAPLGPQVRVLYRVIPCEPCHLNEGHPCPYPTCIRFPSVEDVEASSREFLKRP